MAQMVLLHATDELHAAQAYVLCCSVGVCLGSIQAIRLQHKKGFLNTLGGDDDNVRLFVCFCFLLVPCAAAAPVGLTSCWATAADPHTARSSIPYKHGCPVLPCALGSGASRVVIRWYVSLEGGSHVARANALALAVRGQRPQPTLAVLWRGVCLGHRYHGHHVGHCPAECDL